MQAALCWAQAHGKTALRVATQMGNTAALKTLYTQWCECGKHRVLVIQVTR
ncbi:hypothetical protein [Citrobacter freundii]|uniref:Uncharacterized protein n=1 Tax=Citrobacter freundii TaxID=546 RepID=A0A7G2ISJ1_CITFR|nr:hypothetical protein [Citrobacter freundii]